MYHDNPSHAPECCTTLGVSRTEFCTLGPIHGRKAPHQDRVCNNLNKTVEPALERFLLHDEFCFTRLVFLYEKALKMSYCM